MKKNQHFILLMMLLTFLQLSCSNTPKEDSKTQDVKIEEVVKQEAESIPFDLSKMAKHWVYLTKEEGALFIYQACDGWGGFGTYDIKQEDTTWILTEGDGGAHDYTIKAANLVNGDLILDLFSEQSIPNENQLKLIDYTIDKKIVAWALNDNFKGEYVNENGINDIDTVYQDPKECEGALEEKIDTIEEEAYYNKENLQLFPSQATFNGKIVYKKEYIEEEVEGDYKVYKGADFYPLSRIGNYLNFEKFTYDGETGTPTYGSSRFETVNLENFKDVDVLEFVEADHLRTALLNDSWVKEKFTASDLEAAATLDELFSLLNTADHLSGLGIGQFSFVKYDAANNKLHLRLLGSFYEIHHPSTFQLGLIIKPKEQIKEQLLKPSNFYLGTYKSRLN